MANTKFQVKNGLTSPNIEFKDSQLAAQTIIASMDTPTDTLSFEGDAGQLFSITDDLTGTLFVVSDISGVPSLEIDDQGIVKIAEFNGNLVVGGDSALGTKGVTIQSGAIQIRTDSAPGYVDFYCETNNAHRVRLKSPAHSAYSGNVDVTLPTTTGTLPVIDANGDMFISPATDNYAEIGYAHIGHSGLSGIATFAHRDQNTSSSYAVAQTNAGATSINSQTGQIITFYLGNSTYVGAFNNSGLYMPFGKTIVFEGASSNANETTLTVSGPNKDNTITLPDSSGTVALLSDITGGGGGGGGGVTVQDEGSALSTTGTTLNFVGAGVVASGTGATKTITISGGGSGITVQDEGSSLSTVGTTLNFVGAGVEASGTGSTKTITISGGGGGGGGITTGKAIAMAMVFG